VLPYSPRAPITNRPARMSVLRRTPVAGKYAEGDPSHEQLEQVTGIADNDITQDEVARTMHTSRAMIQQLEAGRRRIELAELILLAQTLKTTPEIILKMIVTWAANVPGLK
jgi:transcriptional regulator with XRE-family HTH domain